MKPAKIHSAPLIFLMNLEVTIVYYKTLYAFTSRNKGINHYECISYILVYISLSDFSQTILIQNLSNGVDFN